MDSAQTGFKIESLEKGRVQIEVKKSTSTSAQVKY